VCILEILCRDVPGNKSGDFRDFSLSRVPGLSLKNSRDSGLARHLERVHDVYIDKKIVEIFTNAKCLNRAKRIRICQPSILIFMKKQSLLEIVA
jgi:hypothetical protein